MKRLLTWKVAGVVMGIAVVGLGAEYVVNGEHSIVASFNRSQAAAPCPTNSGTVEMKKFYAGYFGKAEKTIGDYYQGFQDQFLQQRGVYKSNLTIAQKADLAFQEAKKVCQTEQTVAVRLFSLNPSTQKPGGKIVVPGSGFSTDSSKNQVYINGKLWPGWAVGVDSASQISFKVPDTPGQYNVIVKTPFGISNALSFTVTGNTAPTPIPTKTPTQTSAVLNVSGVWYANGGGVPANTRVTITQNGSQLTISNMYGTFSGTISGNKISAFGQTGTLSVSTTGPMGSPAKGTITWSGDAGGRVTYSR